MQHSLYARLGGEEAINTAVEIFYHKILADQLLAVFFTAMQVDEIKAHQRAFFTAMLGGPSAYDGRTMEEAHHELVTKYGLSDVHFNRTIEHLQATLLELGVDTATVQGLIMVIETLRSNVLSRAC